MKSPKVNPPKEPTIGVNTPGVNPEVYDDCFHVKKSPWGTWVSHNLEGEKIVTSSTQQSCIEATRFYLKMLQDNTVVESRVYDGVVGGKL